MPDLTNSEFWKVLFDNTLQWILSEFPSTLFILGLFVLSFPLSNLILRKIKKATLSSGLEVGSVKALENEKRISTLFSILKSWIHITLWLIFLMLLLPKFGIDLAPLLASAGILGLAIGFGAQELVRDFISGFFIIFENQVRQGDVAVINGQGGVVEKIGLRTIILRDSEGVVHIFQNGKISSLSNMTKDWSAAVFEIGVAYKENIGSVISLMKEVGEEMMNDPLWNSKLLEPLEVMGLERFEDSAVVIKARFKTTPIQQWSVAREYRLRLKNLFDQKGVEIPFPQQTVHILNSEDKSPAK